MKKLFVLFSAMLIALFSFGHIPVKIDDQLLRTFAIQFPHAQKVVWQEHDDSYIVSFVEDGIRVRVVYLRNGHVTQFIRYYLEENLPLDIRLKVKKQFPGKDIHGIVEENIVSNLENRSKTIYYIKLQDEISWLTVRAERHKKYKLIEKFNKAI